MLLDRPGDPRAGIAGTSYGGGLALLAAAYDHRIDAVVAQSAWNNLATALFPNAASGGVRLSGVFARQWAGLLFTQGSGRVRRPAARAGQRGGGGPPAGAVRAVPAQHLRDVPAGRPGRAGDTGGDLALQRSSPASVAGRMDAPALLIQGEHDSLFGLGQANANYQAIRRNGGPAAMVWFAGGHDGGDQQTGYVNSLTAAWFTRWLAPGARPRPCPGGHRAGGLRGDPGARLRPDTPAG